jgi:hypothetical protein
MTAWLSDAATAHMEFTRGSEPDLLSRALGLPPQMSPAPVGYTDISY